MNKYSIATFLAFLSIAYGDQVTLKNGDRITGKVITADEKTIALKTDHAGEVKIDRASVTGIVTDAALNVTLKDSGKVSAKVNSTPEGIRLDKADGAAMTVKADSLLALRDDASQKAYEREQERLTHPRLNDFWSGFISFGLANASGNAKTTTVSTAASAVRAAGKNKMQFNFAQIYATQSTTSPFGATADRISGSFRIDRDISSRTFVYGGNGYDYDRFLALNLRMILGGGFGYHAWKSKKGYFDVAGGGNWNRETFDITTKTTPYTTSTRSFAEASVAQEWGYQPFGKLKLFERLVVFPNLSDAGQYRLNFDTTASVPIMKWLEWNVGFTSRYLSNPLPFYKKNDTILTMGVRASFDQTKQ